MFLENFYFFAAKKSQDTWKSKKHTNSLYLCSRGVELAHDFLEKTFLSAKKNPGHVGKQKRNK